jgi:hypothetical protein
MMLVLPASGMEHVMVTEIAVEGREYLTHANGGDWLSPWHSGDAAPVGTPHGASGFCVTADGGVVLIEVAPLLAE